ncbi:MAG TPA: mechanosensitive ion channel protein MscS [Methylomirabilota bacterium]|jgi:small-conductance mechanosensitive channel|nr:mechanosensitive ion channel protein MscS [Methylomirabilota bacterium]
MNLCIAHRVVLIGAKRHMLRFVAGIGLALLFCVPGGFTQQPQPLDSEAVINHLNAVIKLYRNASAELQAGGAPSDVIYQDNEQNYTADVVRLAFQAARAEAAAIRTTQKNGGSTNSAQSSAQTEARNKARIADVQSKIDNFDKQIASAPKNKRPALEAQKEALEGELNLDNAVLEVIQKRAASMESGNDTGAEGLEGRINQLARSVPGVFASTNDQKSGTQAKPTPQADATKQTPAGLVSQALALYGAITSVHQIDQLNEQTANVRQLVTDLRQPLRDALVADIKKGRDLTDQAVSGKSPPASPEQFQELTDQFKRLSAVVLPLSQEIVVLDQASANLVEWRTSILRESKYAARALFVRVGVILLALGIVLALSEVWRRLTFKYIHDARRRRQFLLMRRFVMGFLIGIVLIMGFVSEFSSLATFAGFVTAGIAVGLQTVLLSVAAYFFVVGRYGIHVGDRVSVSGVTGDVIDISLVRLYLMELAGTGIDLFPTGRVVVFSNSVLFQATTPLFKQIPGTEYAWHEVVFNLVPGGNHKLAQEKLFQAVNAVHDQYREGFERQRGFIEQRIEVQLKTPSPETRLQFGDSGLELLVRYPVEIRNESVTDEQVTRKVLEVIQSNPEVQAAVVGSPKIRAAIKG